MNKEHLTEIQIWSAVIMLAFGISLTIAGFIVPPVGTISDSVLWVLAQSLIYAGSALGITVYIQSEIRGIKQKIQNENAGKSSEV